MKKGRARKKLCIFQADNPKESLTFFHAKCEIWRVRKEATDQKLAMVCGARAYTEGDGKEKSVLKAFFSKANNLQGGNTICPSVPSAQSRP